MNKPSYERANVVIGHDEPANTTVIFIMMADGVQTIQFPMGAASGQFLTPAEMELFILTAPPSDMKNEIVRLWQKTQAQELLS